MRCRDRPAAVPAARGWALLLPLLLSGCYGRPDTLGDPCRALDDCDDEQICEQQICIAAPPVTPEASESGRGSDEPTTGEPTTGEPTTGEPTTGEPTTGEPTAGEPTTGEPTRTDASTQGSTTVSGASSGG